MSEVCLSQMLKAREDRVQRQKQLLSEYRCPLICFTMNIAGPIKRTPLIERGFFVGLSQLCNALPCGTLRFHEVQTEITGCQAMLCVDADATVLKQICISIEEENPLGRLFDMDVLDTNGSKLERKMQRSCIVCGAPGRACAAGRLHDVPDLQAATTRILLDHFLNHDAIYIAELATHSLLEEVSTTPKPGLVDRRNNGSHSDMTPATFTASARALQPYFSECFLTGHKTSGETPGATFESLRKAGLKAEKAMFAATQGINTHKGIIFTMGIVCGAIGRLWNGDSPATELSAILSECAAVGKAALNDWENSVDDTAGLTLHRQYGITGIRGEVASGLPAVVQTGLPVFENALHHGKSRNDAGAITLLHLITQVEDTALHHRGGREEAASAVQEVNRLLSDTPYPDIERIEALDDAFIKRNLSPGGCADLLAVTYFLYDLYSKEADR